MEDEVTKDVDPLLRAEQTLTAEKYSYR